METTILSLDGKEISIAIKFADYQTDYYCDLKNPTMTTSELFVKFCSENNIRIITQA